MAASDRIVADLARHRDLLDLAADGLGVALCKAFTDGALGCIVGEHGPDGTPWAPLSESYARSKARKYPGRPTGVKDFLMAQPQEVAGEVAVSRSEASVTYGTSAQARSEASWFQEGDARRPARPFWGFTPASLDAAAAVLDARLRAIIG